METLKYKVIRSRKQYRQYCTILEELVFIKKKNQNIREEIALLTLLIEDWDAKHTTLADSDPIELIVSLMKENNINQNTLAEILGVGKSVVSEILHYKKGMSKEVIRKLAEYFKLRHEAFNRPYKLKSELAKI